MNTAQISHTHKYKEIFEKAQNDKINSEWFEIGMSIVQKESNANIFVFIFVGMVISSYIFTEKYIFSPPENVTTKHVPLCLEILIRKCYVETHLPRSAAVMILITFLLIV